MVSLDNWPHHLSTAISYNTQGLILNEMERYDEAMKYHSKALEIKKRVLGLGHESVAQSKFNIASTIKKKGNKAKFSDT